MTSDRESAPLAGTLVIELAGLAPVPFAGLILSDLGASVLRIDRPPSASSSSDSLPAPDFLTRGKRAVQLDLKRDRARLLHLLASADVLLDPYRPGVLESILGTKDLHGFIQQHNPRLIIGRLVGFPRTLPSHGRMAGHDLNYLALSGILSLLGRKGAKPAFPHNLLADFAGGSLMLVLGVLAALIARQHSGAGTLVDINMVQGVQYLASFLRAFQVHGLLDPTQRGANLLDSGAHNYDVYETSDKGRYVSLAALEPQFYAKFIGLLKANEMATHDEMTQLTKGSVLQGWDEKKPVLEQVFRRHAYDKWEQVGMGTDACLVGVRLMDEVPNGQWPKFSGVGFEPVKSGHGGDGNDEGWEAMSEERVLKSWQDVDKWVQARVRDGKAKL
ncbi:CoA-transferase family III domain-containing protein [Catenaria anguillulae PL171]|uniref:CoA-transferase family III domain-containing protein n=1 Tax=Catenaria anguillulae PL171 TaxID=765915 RepID=A0A1Y2I3J6_9FUNG|nr:CoA-transferase family III domain-containing protein [Catenaria anguillulae PL171]